MIFSAVFYTLYISKTSKGCFKNNQKQAKVVLKQANKRK